MPTSDNCPSSLPCVLNKFCPGTSGVVGRLVGVGQRYSSNEDKTWIIAPAEASSVSINFTYFDVANESDFVRVYSCASSSPYAACASATELVSYSGYLNSPPGTVVSSTGAMMIRFTSNSSTRGRGWSATWSADAPASVSGCSPCGVGMEITC